MKLFQLFESVYGSQTRELNSELIWFQRHISDHDLETELEIKDDKIVFRIGKKLIKWDVEEARRIRTEVMINANQSYYYAIHVIKGRFELGELVIANDANDAHYSYYYARDVIKGRFELGEPVISKDSTYSYLYARDVIKGQFELGEPAIIKDAKYAQKYQEFLDTLK